MNATRRIILDSRAASRFEAKITRTDTCWLWTGAVGDNGYGNFSCRDQNGRRRTVLAHRVAYELWVGPIPDGLTIDHVRTRGCAHRRCVNPAHLEAVTYGENNARALGDVTHCPRGHEYNEANTYMRGNHRFCRACNAESARRRRQAARAA